MHVLQHYIPRWAADKLMDWCCWSSRLLLLSNPGLISRGSSVAVHSGFFAEGSEGIIFGQEDEGDNKRGGGGDCLMVALLISELVGTPTEVAAPRLFRRSDSLISNSSLAISREGVWVRRNSAWIVVAIFPSCRFSREGASTCPILRLLDGPPSLSSPVMIKVGLGGGEEFDIDNLRPESKSKFMESISHLGSKSSVSMYVFFFHPLRNLSWPRPCWISPNAVELPPGFPSDNESAKYAPLKIDDEISMLKFIWSDPIVSTVYSLQHLRQIAFYPTPCPNSWWIRFPEN